MQQLVVSDLNCIHFGKECFCIQHNDPQQENLCCLYWLLNLTWTLKVIEMWLCSEIAIVWYILSFLLYSAHSSELILSIFGMSEHEKMCFRLNLQKSMPNMFIATNMSYIQWHEGTKIHLGSFVSWNINTIVTEYDLILVTTVITSESMGVEYSLKGWV